MRRVLLLLLLVSLSVGGGLLYPQLRAMLSSQFPGGSASGSSEATGDSISSSLLMLLSQDSLVGPELRSQVLGDAEIIAYFVDSGELYFTHPKPKDMAELSRALQRFCADVSKVGVLENETGRIEIPGGYVLRVDPHRKLALVMRKDNFQVDPEMALEFAYDGASYTATPRVLENYLSNRAIHGGRLRVRIPDSNRAFWNHGAFVAKPGEPSLSALVAELTEQVSAQDNDSREQRIQAWASFVCTQVKYSDLEAWDEVETLKRPSEVLMSRESDCSGKAILMASGLEQLDEEYLLCYYDGHITVAVPQGRFPLSNGLGFEYDGRAWVLCETAIRGERRFLIGTTKLDGVDSNQPPRFIQRPGHGGIVDTATGEVLGHI